MEEDGQTEETVYKVGRKAKESQVVGPRSFIIGVLNPIGCASS